MKKQKEMLSAAEAAEILGVGPHIVRQWVKSGTCPFGQFVQFEGNKRGTIIINRHDLLEWCGKEKPSVATGGN